MHAVEKWCLILLSQQTIVFVFSVLCLIVFLCDFLSIADNLLISIASVVYLKNLCECIQVDSYNRQSTIFTIIVYNSHFSTNTLIFASFKLLIDKMPIVLLSYTYLVKRKNYAHAFYVFRNKSTMPASFIHCCKMIWLSLISQQSKYYANSCHQDSYQYCKVRMMR